MSRTNPEFYSEIADNTWTCTCCGEDYSVWQANEVEVCDACEISLIVFDNNQELVKSLIVRSMRGSLLLREYSDIIEELRVRSQLHTNKKQVVRV